MNNDKNSPLVLEYTTKTISLNIIENLDLLSVELNGIVLKEIYLPNISGHSNYQLKLSKIVTTKKEINESLIIIEEMCRMFNTLSTYIIGFPFDKATSDFYGTKKYIIPIANVNGWVTNYKTVKRELEKKENPTQKKIIHVECSDTTNNWSTTVKSPLHELIPMYKLNPAMNKMTKVLMYFHNSALKNEHDIKHLILGKALEILRERLPYPNNLKKSFETLSVDIQHAFYPYDLDWLFNMSNQRIETRHAINKKSSSGLHLSMSDGEYMSFFNLSDLLISNIVRIEYKLEPRIWKIQ